MNKDKENRAIEARWTPRIVDKGWCAIPTSFLENVHKLSAEHEKPLSSTETLLLVHLASFKWDARAPYPTVGTLAKRMSLKHRAVRQALSTLESRGLIRREMTTGASRYHLQGLFEKLEALLGEPAPEAVDLVSDNDQAAE